MVISHLMGKMWETYGVWLVDRVGFCKKNYTRLMGQLHDTPFEVYIRNDENRAEDGLALRDEFGEYLGLNHADFERDCSVLEMLVALSIRIEEEYIGDPNDPHPEDIFWELVTNLGLAKYSDDNFDYDVVFDILKRWLYRDFDSDGEGSIFPVMYPDQDQTKIEIWEQMIGYLSEKYPL